MFADLSTRLREVTARLQGRGRLTAENVAETVRDLRRALIEADVAVPVVHDLVARVQQRAVGTEVSRSVSPGQAVSRILLQEIGEALGGESAPLDLRHQPPIAILLVGLQGGGKTTTAAKLALFLKERMKRRVMLVSLDTRRPAAMLQLEQLAGQAGVICAPTSKDTAPAELATRAIEFARREQADIVVFDTGGRTRLDEDLLAELHELHERLHPAETLFVLDSMAGQDAVNVAKAFGEAVPLTGIVLTKTDGDTRGGAVLSVRTIIGQPVKFIGSGEKLSALEPFVPQRMASRIMGMGDVTGLVEDIGQSVDHEKADRLARKMTKGTGFDLCDLRDQLQQMVSLGGVESLLSKLPLPASISPDKLAGQADPAKLRRQMAIIDSMTPSERRFPKNINGSRKRRIAAGAGVGIPDVSRLLKQHEQMQRTMKKLSKSGFQRALRNLPPGLGRFPRG